MDILAEGNVIFRVSVLVLGADNYRVANEITVMVIYKTLLQGRQFGSAMGLYFLMARGYLAK